MLKWVLILTVLTLVVFVALLVKLAADSRDMTVSVGVAGNRLTPCPATPNCVSSDVPEEDSHYIAPLVDQGSTQWDALVASVAGMQGASLLQADESYARFIFSTPVLGFVDDVEFQRRPEAGIIAMRSASRVGYSDWQANRKRLEAVRAVVAGGD
jgi:uncharacterized protein (DUF1499 family)